MMENGYMNRRDLLAFLDTQASLPAIANVALYVAVTVTKWSERHQTRRELKHLPDHLCKDIGLTRTQADLEAEKPFWKR